MWSTTEERFWPKVQKTDGCWLWTAAKIRGYGVMRAGGRHDGALLAHRASWQIHFGEVPKGLDVLHRCDNPACVRPEHLFLGDDRINSDDKVNKGRQAKGEQVGTSKLKEKDVIAIREAVKAQESLATQYGISQTQVSLIKNNKRWKHVEHITN